MALSKPEIRALYGRRAGHYDFTANLYYLLGFREWAYRKKAVRALRLAPDDTVVEIGCGTGLNFRLLQEAVGRDGHIIGVDLTGAMLAQARDRVRREGWRNVDLVHADASRYDFPPGMNGTLSTFALTLVPEYHAVVARGARALAPGGRFSAPRCASPACRPSLSSNRGVQAATSVCEGLPFPPTPVG